jgi:hypothetical protein
MLVTRWIWEEAHYIHSVAHLKVQNVEYYLKGVATSTSFKGFRIALETAGALDREGYSPSILAGAGGAWKAQQTLLQTAGALDGEGYSPSVLAGNGGALRTWAGYYPRSTVVPVVVPVFGHLCQLDFRPTSYMS